MSEADDMPGLDNTLAGLSDVVCDRPGGAIYQIRHKQSGEVEAHVLAAESLQGLLIKLARRDRSPEVWEIVAVRTGAKENFALLWLRPGVKPPPWMLVNQVSTTGSSLIPRMDMKIPMPAGVKPPAASPDTQRAAVKKLCEAVGKIVQLHLLGVASASQPLTQEDRDFGNTDEFNQGYLGAMNMVTTDYLPLLVAAHNEVARVMFGAADAGQ